MSLPSLVEIRTHLLQMFDDSSLGIPLKKMLLAFLVLGAAFFIRHLFRAAVLRHVRRWSGHSKTAFNDAVIAALAPPIRFIPIVIAIIAISEFIIVEPRAKAIASEINRSLVALTIFGRCFASWKNAH